MSRQLTHYTTDFEEKKFPLVLICDGVSSPANIGSLFRLADAFNIEKLILCGKQLNLNSARLQKTARGTFEKVPFEQQEDILQVCEKYKNEGYTLFSLEITDDSVSLESMDFSQFGRVALILGNEVLGIQQQALDQSDNRLHIRMFGRNSCMNVAQSAGIALYEITKSLQPLQYL